MDNLKKLLSFESDVEVVGTALSAEVAIDLVRRLTPDVVLMDANLPGVDGIKATQVIASEPPHTPVILMSVQGDRDYVRRATQAGAKEFLVKPFSGDELAAALRRVNQLEKLKRAPLTVPVMAPALTGGDGPSTDGERRGSGQIVLVFSGKGGIGKSMLALNLAAAMARDLEGTTALVDFDLQFGDLGVMLGLDASRNIYQVVEAFPNVDIDFINALMPEAPGGLRVLLGPPSPEFADLVTAEHTRAVLQILQGAYDHIVVDTDSHLGEVTLEAIERAGQIVVLADLSLPAVKEARLALRVFNRLGINSERIKLVLNRADVSAGITAAQIESSLEIKVAAKLPTDAKTVQKATQRADAFVTLSPNVEISQRVRELAVSLVPLHAAEEARAAQTGRKAGFWSRQSAG
ncbi:MAG: MinD/ParA family protein [Chloroflexi bacterium]|nr:MAG: MinD/ParA family protein [Chloroflexota bacterium]